MSSKILVYDEECMYPSPGESDADFEKRMQRLSKQRRATMTGEERRLAADLINGIAPPFASDDDDEKQIIFDNGDSEEYVYQKNAESDSDYKKRMKRLDAALDSRLTDEQKVKVDELMKGLDAAEARLADKQNR